MSEREPRGGPAQSQLAAKSPVNPFLFIVGCPRSGTRLLGRLVGAHPEIAVVHEARFVPGWFVHRRGLTADGHVTREFVDLLADFPRFEQLRVERDELERLVREDGELHYADLVSALFELHGRAEGKRLVADKTPRYVRHIPTLHALFPRARFIHLIRDGRDVFLSVSNWKKVVERGGLVARFPTWTEDAASTAALWWERLVRLGREDGAALPPELYHELRYEQLVTDPARACRELCDFLGVAYDEAMLHFSESVDSSLPGQDSRPPTPGLRDWRAQMPADDVERFEAAAGELLDELGYARSFRDVSPGAREHETHMRAAFGDEIRGRRGRQPAAWQ
jgi:hypothetical protein